MNLLKNNFLISKEVHQNLRIIREKLFKHLFYLISFKGTVNSLAFDEKIFGSNSISKFY